MGSRQPRGSLGIRSAAPGAIRRASHTRAAVTEPGSSDVCRVGQWRLAGFDDAAVSIALPKIPDGGFSPVRLQGRNFKRGLPNEVVCLRPSCPLLPPPALCQGRCADKHLRVSGPAALPQGALAPVRVMLSRSIHT
jgi:hypothetical protein